MKRSLLLPALALAACLALASAPASFAAPTYTMETLDFEAWDINDSGTVVGFRYGEDSRAYVYQNGVTSTVPGSIAGSCAWGIDNAGNIAWTMASGRPAQGNEFYIWDGSRNQVQTIPGAERFFLFQMSGNGKIVGLKNGGGFALDNGTFTQFDIAVTTHINNSGQVLGWGRVNENYSIWNNGVQTVIVPGYFHTVGSFGGLNNLGQVAYFDQSTSSLMLWQDGAIVRQTHVPWQITPYSRSYVMSLNDNGDVLFNLDGEDFILVDGVAYKLLDLAILNGALPDSTKWSIAALNNSGQILLRPERNKSFLLTPTATPIPGAVWLLGSGLLGLLGLRRKRRGH